MAAERDQDPGAGYAPLVLSPRSSADVLIPKVAAHSPTNSKKLNAFSGKIAEEEGPWYILVPMPGTKVRTYCDAWDALSMGLMVVAGYTIPYNLSMPTVNADAASLFNKCLDLFFTWDMLLTFLTAYRAEKRGFSKDTYIADPWMIAKRYGGIPFTNGGQNGWFWPDLVTVLPGWMDALSIGSSRAWMEHSHVMDAAHMVRCLRLCRVMRLLRLAKIMDEIRVRFGVSYFTTDLMKFLFIVSLVAHWAACLWVCIEGKVTDSVLPGAGEEQESWLSALIAAKGDPCSPNAREDPVCVYSIAVYWAIMTLTGIGYGDITPVNHLEYVVCACLMLVAAFVWTYIVASVVAVLWSVNPHEAVLKQRMDELNSMMASHQLPHQLRVGLRRFMLESRHIESVRCQKDLLDNHLSGGLSGKVAELHPVTDIILEKVFWARDLERPALLAIVSSLNPFIYDAHEHIPINERMIVLQSGLCTTSNGSLGAGDVYGIRSVLLETARLVGEYPPFTLSFTDILSLEKQNLREICCRFPKADDQMRKAQIRTAVRRAFVFAAHNMMMAEAARKKSSGPATRALPPRGRSASLVQEHSKHTHSRSFGRLHNEILGKSSSISVDS